MRRPTPSPHAAAADLDLTDPGTPCRNDERVYVARMAQLHANIPVSLIGALLALALTVVVLHDVFALGGLLGWLGGYTALTLLRWWHQRSYLSLPAAPGTDHVDLDALRRWERTATGLMLVAGFCWGLPLAYLVTHAPLPEMLFLLIAMLTLGTGCVYGYCIHPPALHAFTLPMFLCTLAAVATVPGTVPVVLAIAGLVYLGATEAFAWRMYRVQIDSLNTRFENDALLARLAVERDVAERSNLAKSHFLAAASHDLRQPVHALSLYLGVLREQQLNERSRELVEHIGRATTAMGQLFDGLLNISRLDAGVIQPKPRDILLTPLLDQLQLEYAPQAAAKGLTLRLHHGRPYAVHSDPILLDRILRNLVDNAIRHTVTGAVLIGCRQHGDTVRIEVWDTGVGIAEADLEKIFLEFQQVGNPERDRSKGLGLGLAIVRRTADLLGHPLTLRSAPGRGSLFALNVPAADVAHASAAATSSAIESTAARAPTDMPGQAAPDAPLVCIIEDDQENLQGLRLLLDVWGYRSVAGASGAQIVAAAVAAGEKPALIVSDFRLREHETGLDAIDLLHEEFADDTIPAILISGDTDPQRLIEATARAWPLLHKPVDPEALREAVTQLLRPTRR